MPTAMQELGAGSLPFLYSDFHGGLNTLQAPYLLTDNESRDMLNVQGTTAGAILKRNGLVTFASPANVWNSLYQAEGLSPTVLVGADLSALYSISTGGTVTSIGTGFSNARWAIQSAPVVSGRGPIYFMNGTNTPQYWSGTGSTANWTNATGGVSVPNGTMMVYNQNQLFVAGCTAAPAGATGIVDPKSTVFFSALADPTNWDPTSLTGAGNIEFDPNDGQAITALGIVGPYVLVAKPRKLWMIVNPATGSSRKVSENIGCIAARSIASGPEGTYFLSEDRGVMVTNGTKITPISDKIQPTITNFVGNQNLSVGVYFNSHYYLSVPRLSATNDTTLDYDAKLASWWMHGVGSNQFSVWHPSGVPNLYSAKTSSAIIDQCFVPNVFTDNGSNMQWVWRGPWQSPTFYRRRRFPTPYFRKRLRQVRFDGFGTVDFSIAKDFAGLETLVRANALASTPGGIFGASDGTTFGVNDGSVYGGASVQRARVYAGLGVANAFSLVFGSTSSTADAIFSYVIEMTDRRDLIVA